MSGMVIAGGISVLSSCAKIGEATAITSAMHNENVMSFVFSFILSPFVVKIVSETYDSYMHVFLEHSGYECNIDPCV